MIVQSTKLSSPKGEFHKGPSVPEAGGGGRGGWGTGQFLFLLLPLSFVVTHPAE